MFRLFTYGLSRLGNKAAIAVFALWALPFQAQAQDTAILALGDSLTQGYGLLDHEGFVPQLRDWLAARGHDVRIVNGGVSGDTTAGGLARVDWSLTPDIKGMIVALGGNDVLRGIDPAVSRANIQGILDIAKARGLEVLLVGMQAPGNYGPDYKQAFDTLYPELAQDYGTVYAANFFAGIMEEADLAKLMQADGIHPNAKGVALIVADLGPKVEALIGRLAP
jgi:acyl-CoA thioesterase-1